MIGVAGDSRTRVLLAVCILQREQGRMTVREVAAHVGLSLSTTFMHLRCLARDGLIAGVDEGLQGAVRPLVEVAGVL